MEISINLFSVPFTRPGENLCHEFTSGQFREYRKVPLFPTAIALLVSNMNDWFKLTSPMLLIMLIDTSVQFVPSVDTESRLFPTARIEVSLKERILLYCNWLMPGPTPEELAVR